MVSYPVMIQEVYFVGEGGRERGRVDIMVRVAPDTCIGWQLNTHAHLPTDARHHACPCTCTYAPCKNSLYARETSAT